MEVKIPALLESCDRPTDQPTDRPGHMEVSLPINEWSMVEHKIYKVRGNISQEKFVYRIPDKMIYVNFTKIGSIE